MKISDLAALVTVRNHINVVMNDKGVSGKDDFRPLNDMRIKLDKKFIEVLRETNIDDLFPNELLLVKIGDDNYKPTQIDLENWRKVFEESKKDPDFKIFSHNAVNIVKFELNKDGNITIVPNTEIPTIEIGSSAIRDLNEATVSLDTSSSDGFWEDADTAPDHPDDEQARRYIDEARYSQREDELKLEEKLCRDLTDKEKAEIHDFYFKNEADKEAVKKFKGEAKPEPVDDSEEAELALIAERVKAQKEILKKQGRSNKRVSKKEDDPKE
jgi:hypothetical protein